MIDRDRYNTYPQYWNPKSETLLDVSIHIKLKIDIDSIKITETDK